MSNAILIIDAGALAAEVAKAAMRTATLDPDLQMSAGHLALWLEHGPRDEVDAVVARAMRAITEGPCHG